jgi:A/G-specific adenine glycosylase
VLVSEVMLQQTQAVRVVPAYGRFLRRFPDVGSLAAAARREALEAWDGLGYNRRALALAEAARAIVREHGGEVPSDPTLLQRLPGVGPYTAAAVASIAFGRQVAAIDTNVRRVVARAVIGTEPDDLPATVVRSVAQAWLDPGDPGAWNQALMDLGREVCRSQPRCEVCPLRACCRFVSGGATPRPARRRHGSFEGSFRQVRGRVVRTLRGRSTVSLRELTRELDEPVERVADAVTALAAEGLVAAGPAALAGRPSGRVRLPD